MSLQETGKLCWTKALHRLMGNPERVEVLWDPVKWRIGIRPAEDGEGFAAGGGRRYVGVCASMKAAGCWDRLELPIRGRPALQDEEGIWAISVKPEASCSTGCCRRCGAGEGQRCRQEMGTETEQAKRSCMPDN
jgi:hypothetical protein